MAKSVDFDAIADEVDSEEDFGAGLETEPEVETEETPAAESTETEVEPEPEVTATETEDEFTFTGLAKEFGFEDLGGEDDIEAARNALQGMAQLRDYAQRAQQQNQQLQQHLNYLQYQQIQQQQAAQSQPEEATPRESPELLKLWDEVPPWEDSWLSDVERTDGGRLVAREGANPTRPEQIHTRQDWERNALQVFLNNPREFIYQALGSHPEYQPSGTDQIQQAMAQIQDQMEANNIANEVKEWFRDEQGELTPAATAYMEAVQLAEQDGIYGSQKLHQYGMRAAQPLLTAAQAEPETPAQSKKSRQFNWQKQQAQKKGNRGTSQKKKSEVKSPPRDAHDLEREMLAALSDEGVDLDALVTT